MPTIVLPRQLLALTNLHDPRVTLDGGATVSQLLSQLNQLHPLLKTSLFNGGALAPFLSIFIDGEAVEDLDAHTGGSAEVQIVVAVAGG